MPPPPFFDPLRFGTELAYTIVVVFSCFLIYFKTKETYSLTKHLGIKYFRNAFLFFGLSYALRLVFSIARFSGMVFNWHFFSPGPSPILLLTMSYLSTIGIFYLLFSSVGKRLRERMDNKYLIAFSHVIAFVLAAGTFVTRSHEILLYIQSLLLLVVLVFSFVTHKKQKKISPIKVLYILISVFWLINLWAIAPGWMFPFEVKILFQMISAVVFVVMYFRVSKWVK